MHLHKATYKAVEPSSFVTTAWLAMAGLPIAPGINTLPGETLDCVRAYFMSECARLVEADQNGAGCIREQLTTLWVTASL